VSAARGPARRRYEPVGLLTWLAMSRSSRHRPRPSEETADVAGDDYELGRRVGP
jgi:hypothetical protein